MFYLEEAIRKWRRDLAKSRSLEDGYLAELESHLRDDVEAGIEGGLEPETAFAEAVERIGLRDEIGGEYFKTDARGWAGPPPGKRRGFNPAMLGNTLKLAWRRIRRHKGFSLINISGLAVGMACCFLIFLWVSDELSYDRFHDNAGRIFRVLVEDRSGGTSTIYGESPSLLGPTLAADYPEVIRFTRVQSGWSRWYLSHEGRDFMDEQMANADPSFFEVFRFPFIKGDPATALEEPASIVLTRTLAQKIFGDRDPMEGVIQINGSDMKVSGVIEDLPANSQFDFDFIFPIVNMTRWRESRLDDWTYSQYTTYIELAQNTDAENFSRRISGIVEKYLPDSKKNLSLQPLTAGHLHSNHLNQWTVVYPNPGNVTYVYIFSLTAALALLVACMNFMNLATARAGTRAREIGLRKVSGARRSDLVRQFLGESLLTALLAMLGALTLSALVLPVYNRISGKSLEIADFAGGGALPGILVIVLLAGILAGSYPAFFLSAFQPDRVLKSNFYPGSRRGIMRTVLVLFQFSATSVLIIYTLVIAAQMRFIQRKDLGYDPKNIIAFAAYGGFDENWDAARAELLAFPNVLAACRAFPPTQGLRATTQIDWEGKDPAADIQFFADIGDYDFLRVFNIRLAEGRFYSRDYPTDADNYVINRTAAALMGPGSPLGRRLSFMGREGTVIGVVEDYHGGSLHQPIQPKVIQLDRGFLVCVKYRGDTSSIVKIMEEKYHKFVPGEAFQYRFQYDSVREQYVSERRVRTIIGGFTAVTILIACLGLFGLASFTAEQRTKEIGIRKVLGARASGIVLRLSRQFALWVLISNLIAWPLGYWIAARWLRGFAYRIGLDWRLFVLSTAAALALAILSVGLQAYKAANADPVLSLRYE